MFSGLKGISTDEIFKLLDENIHGKSIDLLSWYLYAGRRVWQSFDRKVSAFGKL